MFKQRASCLLSHTTWYLQMENPSCVCAKYLPDVLVSVTRIVCLIMRLVLCVNRRRRGVLRTLGSDPDGRLPPGGGRGR